jgi:transcriptional regulator with XRE-family HTH domain
MRPAVPERWDTSRLWLLVDTLGWTDASFARRLGMDGSTVWRIRHGHIQPSLRFHARVRRLFPEANVDELIAPIVPDEPDTGAA